MATSGSASELTCWVIISWVLVYEWIEWRVESERDERCRGGEMETEGWVIDKA